MTILNETAEILRLYFIQQKKLSLNGIGSFSLSRKPAIFNPSSSLFSAPTYSIEYSTEVSVTPKDVIVFISKRKNISEPEAISLVADFNKEVLAHLQSGEAVNWSGMGSLILKNGQIELTPDLIELPYPETLSVQSEDNSTVEFTEENIDISEVLISDDDLLKNKRNIYLILLAVMAALLIALSIFQNGGLKTHRTGAVHPSESPEQYQLKTAE